MELTDRDLDIFTDFYTHNLLNTDHLASVHCHSIEHKQRLRRRLQKLFDEKYLHRLETPVDRPRDYVLTQRGMDALSNKRGYAPRNIHLPRSSSSYRHHDLALSDFTLSLDLLVRSLDDAQLIDELSLVHRSPRFDVRSHRGWPVTFHHKGESYSIWVKPDRFLGIEFTNRPANQNARYYAIELDCGTMPLQCGNMVRSSIERKLLAYQATHDDKVLKETFALPHAYTLFVTCGARRRDNMIELAQDAVNSKTAAQALLFAVQPPTPSVGDIADLSSLTWINGRGDEVELPL